MDYRIKETIKVMLIAAVFMIPAVLNNHNRKHRDIDDFIPPEPYFFKHKDIAQLTDEILLDAMEWLEIQHPSIVISQARLESGNYKSNIAKKNNNIFGMRMPRVRETTALCESNGYAYYDNWIESLKDYGLWQKKYAYNKTESEYFDILLKKYSEDSNYIQKIMYLCQKYKK